MQRQWLIGQRFFASAIALLVVSGTVCAQVAERADQANARTDENSYKAHLDLMAKRTQGQIDIYFLGDSITRRWGTSDEKYRPLLESWRKNFHGWNAANFGWGGDATQNILWRLEAGELDGVKPKVIVLMAGTNNVGHTPPVGDDEARVEDTSRGVAAIVSFCRAKAPGATLILTGIAPRNDEMAVMPTINRINERIARLANGESIRYININDQLADANGKFHPGMADPDGLHFTAKAYQVWADRLIPIFTELLGPRAQSDRAPPPTGDPSLTPRAH
jgi:lysophospholipase L1-like esterase